MSYEQHELFDQYQAWWDHSLPLVRKGHIAPDSQVVEKSQDLRRGLTVIARLSPGAVDRMGEMLQALATIEPQQYYYPRADIHLTTLALFSATEEYLPHLQRLGEYREALEAALRSAASFTIDSVGVTLTTSAVMAQGFPRDATLHRIRDRLRAELSSRGLGASLDQRYRQVTAHSTLLRFTSPLESPDVFLDALAGYRHEDFGSSVVKSLDPPVAKPSQVVSRRSPRCLGLERPKALALDVTESGI